MEIAADAAVDFGVPVEALYGLVTQESGWNPYAVGDHGNSHGLVQIYQPAHPGITVQQATNPHFALRWAANNLLQNYRR
ncbi:transglycosylase SLT domain-containing protein, partial [Candidatus Bathyarchaeota archaeon]|nr:transglycosylase SLT domain-containing protein [Desulfobacterales bacterium]NIU81766.1 transglycosylase SLT domain-containing protein [Candidatus Bathyarchaeota archaeon]NIV68391.1 transglycosylase SLT domain-containing protein [Candidatus Bathyarchaeota archaeon]